SLVSDLHTRQAGARATDGDRNDVCQELDTALSQGQLSMEEHRERVSAATNATTLGELHSLVSDLQTPQVATQRRNAWSRPPSGSQFGGPGIGPHSGGPYDGGFGASGKFRPLRRARRRMLAWVIALILVGAVVIVGGFHFGNPFGPTTVH